MSLPIAIPASVTRWFLLVLGVATVFGNVWEHLPQSTKATLRKSFPRVWAFGQMCWHYGLIVWPVLKMAWAVLTGGKGLPMVPVVVLLSLSLVTCGPPQPMPSDGAVTSTPTSWVATAEVSVVVLGVALPGAAATVAILPIPAGEKQPIEAGITVAENSLPGLSRALTNYQNSPTNENMCAARAAVKLVADSLNAVATGLSSAGFQTPADVLVSLGGLAELVDELLPACPANTAPAGSSFMSTVVGNLRQLDRPLDGLRPFPHTAVRR